MDLINIDIDADEDEEATDKESLFKDKD